MMLQVRFTHANDCEAAIPGSSRISVASMASVGSMTPYVPGVCVFVMEKSPPWKTPE